MIIEMRTYKMKPGKRAEFLEISAQNRYRHTRKRARKEPARTRGRGGRQADALACGRAALPRTLIRNWSGPCWHGGQRSPYRNH